MEGRSFVIDYENDRFLMDDKPFRYISGSMHYFRVPREHWQDRFKKMKAAGLNAVQTYVDWSQHEPQPGQYDFSGMLDLVSYIKLAQINQLYVIFRAGPYICAEREMGGLPYWLLREQPNITLRTSNPIYMNYVDKWMDKLLPMIKPLLYANGGPILSVQVENEYGSYYACDWDYMNHLRDLFRSYLGKETVLFTTDGNEDYFLKCGKVQGLYATIDFGPGASVNYSFHVQRNHEPRGPMVNSEYYTGRLGHWGYPPINLNLDEVIETLEEMLDMNASVNMYMFHGGTSFGFTNGANIDDTYVADTTSYDFKGPLTESGRVTKLYMRIRKCLKKYSQDPLPPIPLPTPAFAYGNVTMRQVGSLFELLPFLSHGPPIESDDPLTFEQLGQSYGFVYYDTVLPKTFNDPAPLSVSEIGDRGYVFIDGDFVGLLSRTGGLNSIPVIAQKNQHLSILVENQGRVNYGTELKDFKGLTSTPKIGNIPLKGWTMIPIPLNNTKLLTKVASLMRGTLQNQLPAFNNHRRPTVNNKGAPAVYLGNFTLPENLTKAQDTFLTTPGWGKGVAFLNGFNLGRYWPAMGPQITMYVPEGVLKPHPSSNELILVELQNAPCSTGNNNKFLKSPVQDGCYVEFLDHEILNGTTPNVISHFQSRNNGHGQRLEGRVNVAQISSSFRDTPYVNETSMNKVDNNYFDTVL